MRTISTLFLIFYLFTGVSFADEEKLKKDIAGRDNIILNLRKRHAEALMRVYQLEYARAKRDMDEHHAQFLQLRQEWKDILKALGEPDPDEKEKQK